MYFMARFEKDSLKNVNCGGFYKVKLSDFSNPVGRKHHLWSGDREMSRHREDAESCSWSVCPGKQLTERNIGIFSNQPSLEQLPSFKNVLSLC